MSTYMGGETGPLKKVMYGFLILVFIAFVISVPFMIRDKQARLDHAWKTQGCQMYDNEKISDVPAKCQGEFIDHYKAQTLRTQPNE